MLRSTANIINTLTIFTSHFDQGLFMLNRCHRNPNKLIGCINFERVEQFYSRQFTKYPLVKMLKKRDLN